MRARGSQATLFVRALSLAAAAGVSLLAGEARAVPLPKVDGSPVNLEVTETSVVSQRFKAREGESANDQGWFQWLNRLNGVLSWKKLTVATRLDSAVYALRPEDRAFADPQLQRNAAADGATRFRNSLYVAKLYARYKDKGVEVTVGDAYVQFGRGLVLSLRKIDELGIDTTLRGGKVVLTHKPFQATLIAGITNPTRVDEASGRALFLTSPPPGDTFGPQPIMGADRMVGAQVVAGKGLPVVLATHAVMVSKCAPYHYNADGTVETSPFDAPLGTCDEPDRTTWISSLPPLNPEIQSRKTINAGQSVEIPSLWGHGTLYLEAAVQKRTGENPTDTHTSGNALYASLVTTSAPIANTLELKSYQNFFPLAASINSSKASQFSNVAYTAPPTAELVTQDSMFGQFNACVIGARDRLDVRVAPRLLFYGTFGHFVSKSEQPGGMCGRFNQSTADDPDETTDHVTDAYLGSEFRFDEDRSYGFFSFGGRNDVKSTGEAYYQELAVQYSLNKWLGGPFTFEIAGRHRYRSEEGQNVTDPLDFSGEPWWQGEHYNALKISPKWVISQGFEYTTFVGLPSYYLNGNLLYRFTSQTNLKLIVGQRRGGLKCVNGICRNFPAFEGARAELTVRF